MERIARVWTGASGVTLAGLVEGQLVPLSAVAPPNAGGAPPGPIPLSAARRAWQTRKPHLVLDSTQDGASASTGAPSVGSRPAHASLCLPIIAGDEPVGAIYLEASPNCVAFNTRLDALMILAHHCGARIQHMTLQQTMQDRIDWHARDLDGAQDRLTKFNRMALETQMAGGFAHEMRNILSSASLVAEAALKPTNTPNAPLSALAAALGELHELCEADVPEAKRSVARRLLQRAVDGAVFLEDTLKGIHTATSRA